MARIARMVVSGVSHHVTQRGNGRQKVFFCEGDYAAYVALMSQWCAERGVEILVYCLMPNHVHLMATPESEEGRDEFRRHERTGRPLGSAEFVGWLEKLLWRDLRKRKPGPRRGLSRR